MGKITLNNQVVISDDNKPYIVAELNSSHNGDINLAKEMISKAKEIGCDCVKLQSWSKDTLYSKTYYKENPIAKRFVEKFSLDEDKMQELIQHCKNINIDFSSTPYSKKEVDFLVKNNIPFIKIASMEIDNLDYLEYIANQGLPIVLSTGMSTYDEIKQAVNTIEKTKNPNLIILHCVSVYPAPANTINLNNIKYLQNMFPKYHIGYSDHTIGCSVATASITLGVRFIEKHFTLDKTKMGMDNNMATEPNEFKQMIDSCNEAFISLGTSERIITKEEQEQKLKMRRSIVYTNDFKAGHIICRDDLDVKRPGNGISPTMKNNLIGKILKKDVECDYIAQLDDFES